MGDPAEEQKLRKVCDLMADQLAQSLHLKQADVDHAGLYTNGGKPLPTQPEIKAITFSGGVADCVYQQKMCIRDRFLNMTWRYSSGLRMRTRSI